MYPMSDLHRDESLDLLFRASRWTTESTRQALTMNATTVSAFDLAL